MSVTRAYVTGRHGQLHLRRSGPASVPDAAVGPRPPLACFHMSPMSGRIYQHMLAEMGRDRLALALDTPGFGMSDAPASPPSVEDYAADMLAALDALGVTEPCDLMGYHTGSLIAVALARLARSFFDAADDAPFAAVRVPPSADAPRYPARVGSFAP